ncbi:histidine kinase [Nocardioides baekrokdamisoli]|uniref:Histidine kinase n=2 Tax=Nocardioides baekrokdamisoli TaxID=1804624 RepID=A0A3G9J117_9ACTN|nr:histidine kinase [Nocardioides baekrokdamisoli]
MTDSLLGGVAAGLADHLGLPVLGVRAFFILTTALSGLGLGLYAACWVMLPAGSPSADQTVGAEAFGRLGLRPRPLRRMVDLGPTLALVAFGAGGILLLGPTIGIPARVLWPLMAALAGVGLLWRQADEAQRSRWTDPLGRMSWVRFVFGGGGWGAYARAGAGLVLVLLGLLTLSLQQVRWSDVRTLTLAFVFALGGVALVVGPWVSKLVTDLATERAERVRSQERADVAAHLHDSVLQTLAMIQRSAGDPETVAQLARSQERDLRTWLYEPGVEGTVAAALRQAAAEIEDTHRVKVDAVVVGDAPLTESSAIVAAAREAMANAARHGGGSAVSVYAEVSDDTVEVFVRDRGPGFDIDAIPADRHGVRDSIVGRMERHGGTAEIVSQLGEGTNVRLRQPRGAVA